MNAARPLVLLIQPPIYDFTAFDFFLYPLGLVHVGEVLRQRGYRVRLIDALDRYADVTLPPGMKKPTFRDDGCGHFHRIASPPPAHLAGIPRRYHRFGLPRSSLAAQLREAGRPAAAAVSCSMTYWYPGVMEVKALLRAIWPGTPVILGGAYATLCPDHARKTVQADFLLDGRDLDPFLAFLFEQAPAGPVPASNRPGHDLVGSRISAAVPASSGCPRRCPYCAAHLLGGPFHRRPVQTVVDEIVFLVRRMGRKRIAFYDDALIDRDEDAFLELAGGIMARGLHREASFHCPNALLASAITPDLAVALKKANFKTVRIGFETADPSLQENLGGKATNNELEAALRSLLAAGFSRRDLGVYILAGLPGQEPEGIAESIRFVHRAGAMARLAEYAPVPDTPLFEEARKRSSLDLDEPVNHNKTLASYRFPELDPSALRRLKDLCRELNRENES